MARRFGLGQGASLGTLALAVFACGNARDATRAPDVESDIGAPEASSGVPPVDSMPAIDDSSYAQRECSLDAECRELGQDIVEYLNRPLTTEFVPSVGGCHMVNAIGVFPEAIAGPACSCSGQTNITIGPVGAGCYFTARTGECLWGDEDFAGCDISDPNACDAVCERLDQLHREDHARTLDLTLATSYCEGECGALIELNDLCRRIHLRERHAGVRRHRPRSARGEEDCGLFIPSNFAIAGDTASIANPENWALLEGGARYELGQGLDLAARGIGPRYAGTYTVAAEVPGGEIVFDGLRFPEALNIAELDANARLDHGALALTWTGRGSAPLRIYLSFPGRPSTRGRSFEIHCLATDDGAFTVPAELIAQVPAGEAIAEVTREERVRLEASGSATLGSGIISRHYQFFLDDACERSEVAAACASYAARVREVQTECGLEPSSVEALCPRQVTEACSLCPSYFECQARLVTCDSAGFLNSGCLCL